MMKMIGLPMPPTVNSMYATFRGRRIKSREARAWERDVDLWILGHATGTFKTTQLLAQKALTPGYGLQVDCIFHFPKDKLIGKKGQTKRIDASNRIKPLHDKLSQLLGVDDSHFWLGSFEKRTSRFHEASVEVHLEVIPITHPEIITGKY